MKGTLSFDRRKTEILLCILFFLSSFAIAFSYCERKQGMNEDETVTFGLANSHNATWIYNVKDGFNGSDMTDNILYKDEIRSYLTADEGQLFDLRSAYTNQINDVHPPLYYMIINIASSLNPGVFSKWNGLIPNLIIWSLQLLLIYLLGRKTYDDRIISGLAMLLFGLSTGSLSNLLFIRMYILLGLMAILLCYVIVCMMKKESLFSYLAVTLAIFLGFFTHYNYAFFAFLTCLVFGVYLLFTDYKKAIKFGISAFLGVGLFLLSFPYIFQQMSVGAVGGSVSASSSMKKLFDVVSWVSSVNKGLQSIIKDMLPAMIIMAICAVLIVVFRFIYGSQKENENKNIKKEDWINVLLIGLGTLLTICMVSILNPLVTGRYFYFLLPVISYIIGYIMYLATAYIKRFSFMERKVSEYTLYVMLFIAVFGLSYGKLRERDPKYIFEEYGAYRTIAREYGNRPTVYLSSDEYKGVHDETLQFWFDTDDVFITCKDLLHSSKLERYLQDHAHNEELVLYIDTSFADVREQLAYFEKEMGYQDKEELFYVPRTFVVLLSR